MINYVNPQSRRKELELHNLVKEYFAPKMIEAGWEVVTGLDFIKIKDNHIVNVFGFQGNWKEEEDFYNPHLLNKDTICCETAIHFDFLPDFEKIRYPFCEVRNRLSPLGEGNYHWGFSSNEDKNIEMIDSIWTAFENHSPKFYKDFENFPYPFDQIKPEDIEKSVFIKILNKYHFYIYSGSAKLLKDINQFIGNKLYADCFLEIEKIYEEMAELNEEDIAIWQSEGYNEIEFENPFL
ncbi:hypothetical protein [Maribacter aquivivus]|uniref:hypothetical protein n=1 Tax=Maribacter aquivivus TaxID=228958 RepID=UPI0024949B82|nr:hypothetical protein [Maribacter aquivivus]